MWPLRGRRSCQPPAAAAQGAREPNARPPHLHARVWPLARRWARATHAARQPEKLLELYEFENCPFCRRVREALSVLDLDAMIYPCPRGLALSQRRRRARRKDELSFLVDPNTNRQMYESAEIVRYLATTYGDGVVPLPLRLGPLTVARLAAASLPRQPFSRARPSVAPARSLGALQLRGLPVLPHRAGAVAPRAAMCCTTCWRQPEARGVRRALGEE
ncbi:MAG: glutathione S-transferase N-terminal domain-containing protein [Polyangiaceae bacterium]|nr:glutathione S-transferase N-terminal domain-containing protein [Polyangiaceae bacterium]